MDIFEGLAFELLKESDIEELTPVMKGAFEEDAKRHLNESGGGPEGYDNGDFLRTYGLDKNSIAYRVSLSNQAIGAAIVWINQNGENYLGNMFIDASLQDKGYGLKVWKFIEKKFPDTRIWKTDTPGFSKRNHVFYINKCGFKLVKIENPGHKYDESYLLEKVMQA